MVKSSPIIVAPDLGRQTKNTKLVQDLKNNFGIEAIHGDIPVDLLWTVDGVTVLGDLKTPGDLISSVKDGRLHEQTLPMKQENTYGFILIEADELSFDGGHLVGNDYSGSWTWEQFDSLLQSLQEEGIKVLRSSKERYTARRVASLYGRLEKEERGSWHRPIAPLPDAKDFLDAEYREKVGFLMHIGKRLDSKRGRGMGQVNAEKLLQEFGLMATLGITEEGLQQAFERWKSVKGIGDKLAGDWKRWLSG